MTEPASTTLPGVVEKIIKPIGPGETEKAQIHIEGAEHLYQEIRIENALTGPDGEVVALEKGSHVEVTVEATPDGAAPSPESKTR